MIVTAAPVDSGLLIDILADKYDLTVAGAGAEALSCLRETPDIDLVLLAGSLPDVSDVRLLQSIRDLYSARDLPLIMLANDGSADEVARAFQNGADNCLVRPFTEEVISARVAALLKIKRSIGQVRTQSDALAQAKMNPLQICRMASHDLRSMLSNISLAEAIMRDSIPDGRLEMKQSLKVIRLMVDNMEELITNYLDVIEMHSGQLRFSLKPTNLRDVVQNVVGQFAFAADKKDIKIQVSAAEGWVLADGPRLVQVLGNLVSNAIKYSPYQSTVNIYTARENAYCRINVEDQGPGIPPQDRDRLFQQFGKLSTRATGGESRTGLGLWIVKQLIEAQEGTVGAEFPPSGGSRFWIALRTYTEVNSEY